MRISDWSSDVCSSDLFKVFDNNDPDGVPLPVLSVNNARQKQRQFTQELRLTSPAGEPIEYVVGLYYFWQDVVSRTQVKGKLVVNLPGDLYLGNQVDRDITTKNVAAFGQLTGLLTVRLSLSGGRPAGRRGGQECGGQGDSWGWALN